MPLSYKKEINFSEWYHEVLLNSKLVDFSTVKGCLVLRPDFLELWKQIQTVIDGKLNSFGYQNYYFPMLIPKSILQKQDEHFRVFYRETARVTKLGDQVIEDELILRPTSEAVIYDVIKSWVKSDADLPLRINQWCNVIRWEIIKKNLPLIRDNEFMWHEAHAVFATEKEADKEVYQNLDMYEDLIENYLAIPVFRGSKPGHRRFAGAKYTLALESMMPNCKSVQIATSHSLGQNFSKAFSIKHGKDHSWQSCSGLTTRMIGALVMMHSDNQGLVLPPKIASVQCALIGIKNSFKLIRTSVNIKKPEAILKGIPLIIEKSGKAYLITRRDTMEELKANNISEKNIQNLLDKIQSSLFSKAKKFKDSHTFHAKNYEEFTEVIKNCKGFMIAPWCSDEACAKQIRNEASASLRIVNPIKKKSSCIKCGKNAVYEGIFGQSY